MFNFVMMVPDTLLSSVAVNSPVWTVSKSDEDMLSAARHRIEVTQSMNKSSDEQIVKSKLLMSKGVARKKMAVVEPEPA
ncbi:MAG: hypothetical protein AB8B63_00645 [Granulosicoccus sp.]